MAFQEGLPPPTPTVTNQGESPILQKLTPPPLHEAVLAGGIYVKIDRTLDVIRLLFSIIALLYFGTRMMVLSGIMSQEWAKYSLYLEPGLFLLVCLYLGQWVAKLAVSASLRFASIRFVTLGISALLTLAYTLYWSHVLSF
ncbi:MAG: hypothetical protein U0518_00975 [Candidatus Gracilibacteria bacterium]